MSSHPDDAPSNMRTLHERRSAHDASIPDRGATPPAGWMCEFVITACAGTTLHPVLGDLVEEVLEHRAPVLRCRPDEITVMCNVPEAGLEQASVYADKLAGRLIGHLAISPSQLDGPTLHQYRQIDEFGAHSAEMVKLPRPDGRM